MQGIYIIFSKSSLDGPIPSGSTLCFDWIIVFCVRGNRVFRSMCRFSGKIFKATEKGCKVTERGCKVTEKGCKVTEKGCKVTEKGCKVTEKGCKVTEKGCKAAEKGCKVTEKSCKDSGKGCKVTLKMCMGLIITQVVWFSVQCSGLMVSKNSDIKEL